VDATDDAEDGWDDNADTHGKSLATTNGGSAEFDVDAVVDIVVGLDVVVVGILSRSKSCTAESARSSSAGKAVRSMASSPSRIILVEGAS
jgi:hypothetical protein